jgi:hypothetical protein
MANPSGAVGFLSVFPGSAAFTLFQGSQHPGLQWARRVPPVATGLRKLDVFLIFV